MLKLYKKTDEGLLYWETWDKDTRTGVIHWGKIGTKGESKEINSTLFSNFRKQIQKEITQKGKEGFSEFEDESLNNLVIEYKVDQMGTETDLIKRHALESKLNEFLGWQGIGHCDGGSMGSGTMEVMCPVVDFNLAKDAIENELKETEFSDYSRIYKEE